MLYYLIDIVTTATLVTILSERNSKSKNVMRLALVWLVGNYLTNLGRTNYLWYAYDGFVLSLILVDLEKNIKLL